MEMIFTMKSALANNLFHYKNALPMVISMKNA